MIPNNNLSVLPWYTSLDQQNARKWWVFGRVYPLFSPGRSILPFQIMRDPIRVEDLSGAFYSGEVPLTTGVQGYKDGTGTTVYDSLSEISRLYLYNIPAAPIDVENATMMVAFDEERNVLATYRPIISGTFTGYWDLPAGTESVDILTYNNEISALSGYAASVNASPDGIYEAKIYDSKDNLIAECTNEIIAAGLTVKGFDDYDVIVFPSNFPVFQQLNDGQYYLRIQDRYNTWYSEIFTVVNDIEPYLKIEWFDREDFIMDAGAIVYRNPNFKNVVYLQSDIAKPEYVFEEEGETRDGYFFPIKQISEKRYRFSFLASEYLLDVMRFIRMSDYINIEYHGQRYKVDSFLLTPTWENNGDVAAVDVEFDTATVAKKIGRGYMTETLGDYNNDFNNDFNN